MSVALFIAALLIFNAGVLLGCHIAALRAFKQGVREGYHEAQCELAETELVIDTLHLDAQREMAPWQ